jgi:hypothetical protein
MTSIRLITGGSVFSILGLVFNFSHSLGLLAFGCIAVSSSLRSLTLLVSRPAIGVAAGTIGFSIGWWVY